MLSGSGTPKIVEALSLAAQIFHSVALLSSKVARTLFLTGPLALIF
jgi:hypothetical protein